MTTICNMAAGMFVVWMETFFCSQCMFFFKDLVLLQIGTSFFYFFMVFPLDWRFTSFLTLKLSAVILAPAGTVYMLLGDKGSHGGNSIVANKLITGRVLIDRCLAARSHHVILCRMGHRMDFPMGADIILFLGCYGVDEFRMQSWASTPFNSSGEVQSELFTEEIPAWRHPKTIEFPYLLICLESGWQTTGVCDLSHHLAFILWIFTSFCWELAPVHII